MLSEPFTVIRDATLNLANTVDAASDKSSAENRLVLSMCKQDLLLVDIAHVWFASRPARVWQKRFASANL